jgi:hypothetical protein
LLQTKLMETSLYQEVNGTEDSPSVRLPCLKNVKRSKQLDHDGQTYQRNLRLKRRNSFWFQIKFVKFRIKTYKIQKIYNERCQGGGGCGSAVKCEKMN